MVKLNKGSIFYHHGDTICHRKSGYITTKLHGMSMQQQCDLFRQSYFQVSCHLRMSATLIWPRRSIGSSFQIGKMASLLNSLFFVFKISFLPKYRVIFIVIICKVVQWDIMGKNFKMCSKAYFFEKKSELWELH